MPAHEVILVFCAHNDDQVIGAGGTLARYAQEGKEIFTYIFSFGEKSHPHLQKKVIAKIRVRECKKADKILGIQNTFFFGIKENEFYEEFKRRNLKQKLINILHVAHPSKIFTHALDDPHPDHRAVHDCILTTVKEMKLSCDIYSFDIWNLVKISHRNEPKLVVNITDTFSKKIAALSCHKSQKLVIWLFTGRLYVEAFINGLNNNCKFAEVFHKVY